MCLAFLVFTHLQTSAIYSWVSHWWRLCYGLTFGMIHFIFFLPICSFFFIFKLYFVINILLLLFIKQVQRESTWHWRNNWWYGWYDMGNCKCIDFLFAFISWYGILTESISFQMTKKAAQTHLQRVYGKRNSTSVNTSSWKCIGSIRIINEKDKITAAKWQSSQTFMRLRHNIFINSQ